MNPQQFVAVWHENQLKERSAAQSHFIDLCRLVGHPTPAEDDPTGTRFTFEAGAEKLGGGQGWADVYKRGYFAWEYKGKHANLDKAYQQLLRYRESLENPPLLIVSDIERIIVHTNFTNTVKREVTITLDDLLTVDGMRHLRDIFYEPTAFQASKTTAQVTQEAATEFAQLAEHLRKWGEDSDEIAHFLIRLLFCLFAEDINLLPKDLFSRLVDAGRRNPQGFNRQLRQLFNAMAHGDFFGVDTIPHFNGGLFDDDAVIDLDHGALSILHRVAALDWSSMEPSILGTLFERSLDPNKRSQLGAHYTSRDDILLIVEPVLMQPLRRRWNTVQADALKLVERRDATRDRGTRTQRQNELSSLLQTFTDEIAAVRVLDPACGSGNFLYVALQQLLDLEKEVTVFGTEVGLPGMFPKVSPTQLYGIELNTYAHQLAQATVWIGYIQWLNENGFGTPSEPILKPLDNIRQMDAILAYDEHGQPVEPEWPVADVIIGNPPFLGDRKMRGELGDDYVDVLRTFYGDALPPSVDLVCYWFELARRAIVRHPKTRVGLLATNSIRGGSNRHVLNEIKVTGDIFLGWSNRPWILEGAAVRVSMVGFDAGKETIRYLDGQLVPEINSDLTKSVDLTIARTLSENAMLSFIGTQKSGPFDLSTEVAIDMLGEKGNPNGRPNSDVVKPWMNALDVTRRPRDMWIVDFGPKMPLESAADYQSPFEWVLTHVKPIRDVVRRKSHRDRWWLFGDTRPGMRTAIANLARFIVTPMVSKHRVFIWVNVDVIPENLLVAIARDDDYFFGVLHARPHELWSLRMGTSLEDRPRYTPTTTFETYPFPWPPGTEPTDDPRVQAIAQAAKELVEKRDAWLNPPGLDEKELKKRTLTNLYNQRPTWLDLAHKKLDKAVFAAYGWPEDITDEEILERLLALNLERAGDAVSG